MATAAVLTSKAKKYKSHVILTQKLKRSGSLNEGIIPSTFTNFSNLL